MIAAGAARVGPTRTKRVQRPGLGSRGAERNLPLKDPEAGAVAPGAVALSRSEPTSTAERPAADPSAPFEAGARRASPGVGEPPRGRKRRKRRRGRKVFDRDHDGAAAAPAEPDASPVRHRRRAKSRRASSLRSSRTPSRRRSGRAAVTICRCLPRSTSAPTIAACWSPCPAPPGQFRVVDAFSRIVRLGEGLSASGRLAEPAMDRAVEALKICADKLGHRTVRHARADRHRGLPRRRQRRGIPRRVSGRDRARPRDHRPRDRGAPGGLGLRLAGRAATPTASCCSTSAAALPRSR